MSSPGLLRPGIEMAGYTIEGVLGRGATATVYRATHPSRDAPVALKLISTDLLGPHGSALPFAHEARLAAAVAHRGILPVYEAGEDDGRPFVAMKLESGDLRALLRRERRLSPPRAVAVISQIASALDAAHTHGLVHRDVKPSNVLLGEEEGEERAYLADFGVARARFSGGDPGAEMVGTIGYASPEQIRGDPVDRRTDVYALGCLLYECITGRAPYAGRDGLAVLWGHLHAEPPQPSLLVPTLSRDLDDVVARALAKDPEARFASAGELAEAARTTVEVRSLPAPREEATPPPGTTAGTNLSTPATTFLGRERELHEADSLLQEARLLSVTAPGGAGKTRFALELAARAGDERPSEYEDGVFGCFLASLRDPAFVLTTVAQALSVPEKPGLSVFDALSAHIGARRMLVLVDNVEHMAAAVPELEQLLACCPGLTLLVTSRERLRVGRELVYELPPLAHHESVALFCERAACEATHPIAELCSRLDGLPLAIELAAAQVPVLSPSQILERLARKLDVTGSGRRDVPERQRTLRATIDWSYDLLAEHERTVFRRLGVFAGSFELEAAAAVGGGGRETLESLVDKSLLRRLGGGRFAMLHVLGEYALDRLGTAGETRDAVHAHLRYYQQLVQRLEPELRTSRHLDAIERLEADHANLVRAIECALEGGDSEGALDLFARLKHLWWDRGSQGWLLAQRVLAAAPTRPTLAHAGALHAAAGLAWSYGEVEQAASLDEQALAIYEEIGDPARVGSVLVFLGTLYQSLGRTEARATLERGLALMQAAGDEYGIATARGNLSDFALQEGDFATAALLSEQSAVAAREHGFEQIEAMATCNLAVALVHQADPRARQTAHSALRLCVRTDMHLWIGNCLFVLAAAIAREEPQRAAVLLGAAESELGGARLAPAEAAAFEKATTAARGALGEPSFGRSTEEGRTLGREAAVELALVSGV